MTRLQEAAALKLDEGLNGVIKYIYLKIQYS
ncbi:unnamed protein product, partial [marine sediment metagenome]